MRPRRLQLGFSLIELVIVVVIIGIIAAIAVPRFSSAIEKSADAAVAQNVAVLQKAIDLYTAEHADLSPAREAGGATSTPNAMIRRLIQRTDASGALESTGIYGPYLRAWPENPANGRRSLRIDGAAAGANTHGWRFDSATGVIQSDAPAGAPPAARAVEGDLFEADAEVAEEDR